MCTINRSDGFVVQAGDPEPEGDKVIYTLYIHIHIYVLILQTFTMMIILHYTLL
jgi:hypothetical protein